MSVQSDKWIIQMARENDMISPFEDKQVRGDKISFGVSSYGYDARVSDEFKIFTNVNSEIVDPKNFKSSNFITKNSSECIIPPNSFVLARTVEYFKIPKNVRIIKGKIQDTLDNFLNNNSSQKIIFTHMDMDTYTPTKYALNKIKPFLQKGSIILFDELYGFPNWQYHEYKALKEGFNEKEYKYFAFGQRQIAIEIL